MNRKDFEIMAPVGSRESLAAAINAGADSIYFGIENLNMRARSANTFSIDDLREIAATCDEHGVKSYLTVNTIIYDEDIAKRVCTPSELKKTRNGERRPNSSEEWLDTQARALYQAASLVRRCAALTAREEAQA